MLRSYHDHAPLLWIAISVGWAFLALVLGVLSDAHWGSVLWTVFARLFLILAVAASTLALWNIASRWLGLGRPRRVWSILRRAPVVTILLAAAWWESASNAEAIPALVMLAGVAAMLIWIVSRPPEEAPGSGTVRLPRAPRRRVALR